jgi:hypothetical protein
MELAILLFHALLIFHPRWQETACDEVGERNLERCESLQESGQNALDDFTRTLARTCELYEEPIDCLMMAMVAEKESTLGDLSHSVAHGDTDIICQKVVGVDRIVAIEPREGEQYCETRMTWTWRGGERQVTRNVHIVTHNERSYRVDTCCAREHGYFQLLPNNFSSGTRVRLPVGNGCGEYDGNPDYCEDGHFIFPRSQHERRQFIDRVEWNVAVGVQEVVEHLAICPLDEDDHPLLGIAAYNQGDCVHDSGFKTYFTGVRSRYSQACEATLPDGTTVADHWDGCNDIPADLE